MWTRAAAVVLWTGVAILVFVTVGASYRLVRAQVELEVYRHRLGRLAADYDGLRERYNAAVRETVVTELVVEDGLLSVSLRSAEGELRRIETDFDPALEVYVDFVVRDGRLWIRRIFDERTPPGEGLVIDPALASLDWRAEDLAHGKAAYRALAEGRWAVTVTGDGSLGLARAGVPDAPLHAGPPAVARYAPVEQEVRERLDDYGALEISRALLERWTGTGER